MGTRESIPAPLRLSLSGPAAVHDATAAAREFAATADLDKGDATRLAIVVEELVTNLYDHAGLNDGDVFDIELAATGSEISLVVSDEGRSFDPRSARSDDTIPSRGGGAGLRLVRAWASKIDYQSTDGLNRLSVLLPRARNA